MLTRPAAVEMANSFFAGSLRWTHSPRATPMMTKTARKKSAWTGLMTMATMAVATTADRML